MTILFNLSYNTVYGEEIMLNIISGDDASTVEKFKMATRDGNTWTCTVNSLAKPGATLNYYYSVVKNGIETRREWLVEPHQLVMTSVTTTGLTFPKTHTSTAPPLPTAWRQERKAR